MAEAASAPWPTAAACGPATATTAFGGMSSPPWSPNGVTVMSWPGDVIGRDGELGYVAALLAQLEDGPAALIFTGEPGIGKTTALLAAAERSRASSAVVLTAHPVYGITLRRASLSRASRTWDRRPVPRSRQSKAATSPTGR